MTTVVATYMQTMSYETDTHAANARTDYTQGYLKNTGEIHCWTKINKSETKENLYAALSSRRPRHLLLSNCGIIQDT